MRQRVEGIQPRQSCTEFAAPCCVVPTPPACSASQRRGGRGPGSVRPRQAQSWMEVSCDQSQKYGKTVSVKDALNCRICVMFSAL